MLIASKAMHSLLPYTMYLLYRTILHMERYCAQRITSYSKQIKTLKVNRDTLYDTRLELSAREIRKKQRIIKLWFLFFYSKIVFYGIIKNALVF